MNLRSVTAAVFLFAGTCLVQAQTFNLKDFFQRPKRKALESENLSLKTALISFIVSFGGLSVVGQSISMTSGSGIRAACILKIKLTHGLLAGIISVILSRAVL